VSSVPPSPSQSPRGLQGPFAGTSTPILPDTPESNTSLRQCLGSVDVRLAGIEK